MKPIDVLFSALLCIPSVTLADTPGEVPVGGYLREATLHGLNNPDRKFSEYRGKPLIINVWASWCEPCRLEMGDIESLARRFNGKQFNVIGISTDDDSDAALRFVWQQKLSFANYLDSNMFLENMLGANTIPLTILVDANGRILDKVHGARKWNSPAHVQAIEVTLGIKLPRGSGGK